MTNSIGKTILVTMFVLMVAKDVAAQQSPGGITPEAFSDLSGLVERLAARVDVMEEQNRALRAELDSVRSRLDGQQRAIAAADEKNAAQDSSLGSLNQAVTSIRSGGAALEERLGKITIPDLAPLAAEIEAIKKVNERQGRSIESLVSKEEALMVAATGLQEQIDGLSLPDLGPVEDALSSLESRQKAVESAVGKLRSGFAEQTEAITELRGKDEALMVAATGLQAQIDGLERPDDGAASAGLAELESRIEYLSRTDESILVQLKRLRDLKLDGLREQVDGLSNRLAGVSRDGDTLRFDAMNVQITSGSGATDGKVNGLGNLIIGYNESITPFMDEDKPAGDKSGSHNLIVGRGHNYSGYGGAAVGLDNVIAGNYGLVAGTRNRALGNFSSVTGGQLNTASGWYSSVGGGFRNVASANSASVSGGQLNAAAGAASSVSGGYQVSAPGNSNWAAGRLFQHQ